MATPDFILGLRAKIGNDLLEVPTASGLVFDDDNRVLLIRHSENGLWSLPGGMIEPYESPTDAAIREVYEETGVHIRITAVVGVFGGPEYSVTFANGDRLSYIMTAFRGERISGEPRSDGDETSDVGYFTREVLASMHCSHLVAPVLAAADRDSPGAWFPPATWAP